MVPSKNLVIAAGCPGPMLTLSKSATGRNKQIRQTHSFGFSDIARDTGIPARV